MLNRYLKTFGVILLTTVSFFFILNYYLPSKIDAIGPAGRHKKPAGENKPATPATAEVQPVAKKSIATELGVSAPITKSYPPFLPENVKKQKNSIKQIFAVPEALKTEVAFWKDIYTKYDKTKVVFHDKEDLGTIYSVINISDIINNERLSDEEIIRLKEERVEAEYEKIAETLSPEKREQLRSQTGVRDKFIEGIKTAGRYLGEMEKIFTEYGIPLEITRLAFIESMFNLKALSKVGASGIWQFMPGTGRLFLTINQYVDERNDPIAATDAAARHLLRDYNELQTWPLAINAYNTGRGRLVHAVARLGTKDISRIIKEWGGAGYGFASRNFYPAFLAALEAFEDRKKYFGQVEMDKPLAFDVVYTPFSAALPEIAKYAKVPFEELVILNFQLQENVMTGDTPLPRGFPMKVPKGRGEDVLVAMDEMSRLPATSFAKE